MRKRTMTMSWWVVLVCVGFGVLNTLAWGDLTNTRIAFTSDRDGNEEIYVMGADGSNPTRLTNNPAMDTGPVWSPDGTQLAFSSKRDGNFEIYVMGADGSNPTRLTNNPAMDGGPAWSPDGTQLAFTSDRDGNDATRPT